MKDSGHSNTSYKPYERLKQSDRNANDGESTVGSLRRSLRQALHSFWDDASPRRPKVQQASKRPQPVLEKSISNKIDTEDVNSSQKEQEIPIQWKDNKPPSSFEDMPLPAHLVISAYRDAIMNELKRGSRSPPTEEKPRKQQRVSKPVDQQQQQQQQHTPKPHNSTVTTQTPRRIELVTKPLVDLSQLPPERKKRPGFISVDFDVSDEEPSMSIPEQPKPTLRRPSKEDERLVKHREAKEEEKTSQKPLFSFAGGPQQSESKPLELSSQPPPKTPFSFQKSDDAHGSESLNAVKNDQPAQPGQVAEPSKGFSFNFGKTDTSKAAPPEEPPKEKVNSPFQFSLGGQKQSTDTPGGAPEKAVFSFQNPSGQGEIPKFSFGTASQSTEKQPAEMDATKSKPFNFSFGASTNSDTNLNKEPPKTNFSFGGSQISQAPTEAVGLESKQLQPKESESKKLPPAFPGTSDDKSDEKSNEPPSKKPLFSFGSASSGETSSNDKPTFTFGASGASNSAKSIFNSNGTSSESKQTEPPKFNFGASAPAAKPSEKPAFSFGASSAANSVQPKIGSDNPAPLSNPFQGSTANSTSSTPFNFGSILNKPADSTGPKSETQPVEPAKNTTDSLSSTNSNAKPAFSFGSSAFAKPSAGTSQPFSFGAASTDASQPASGSSSTAAPASGFNFAFGANSGSGPPFGKTDNLPFGSNSNSAASSKEPTPAAGIPQTNTMGFNFGPAQPAAGQSQQIPGATGFNFNFGAPAPAAQSSNPVAGRPLARPRRRLPARR